VICGRPILTHLIAYHVCSEFAKNDFTGKLCETLK